MIDIEQQIVRMYLNGESTLEIGRRVGFSHTKIIRILERHNVPRRTKKEALAKYVKYHTCDVCGKVFRVKSSWRATTNSNRKTCSDYCFRKLMQTIQNGQNNSFWKGGHSQSHYTRIRKETKTQICERCGKSGNEKRLDTHHIDKDKSNNSPDNIVVLCARCHALEHYEKEDRGLRGWKPHN